MKLQSRNERDLRMNDTAITRTARMTFRQKGIGVVRIFFGIAWAVAAILKWQPEFITTFATTVGGAKDGQPPIIQAWINLWLNIVHINPILFAVLAAIVESLLAICFLFGAFTNTASLIGLVWSFFVWSVPEGFGGPFVAGQSTDIGTGYPYILLCVLLLLLGSGRYFGIDRVLTPKLGRFGFLAAGPLRMQEASIPPAR
jgi:uncharacterized membrane protein YphA (DoxX/SURF4 family)